MNNFTAMTILCLPGKRTFRFPDGISGGPGISL